MLSKRIIKEQREELEKIEKDERIIPREGLDEARKLLKSRGTMSQRKEPEELKSNLSRCGSGFLISKSDTKCSKQRAYLIRRVEKGWVEINKGRAKKMSKEKFLKERAKW